MAFVTLCRRLVDNVLNNINQRSYCAISIYSHKLYQETNAPRLIVQSAGLRTYPFRNKALVRQAPVVTDQEVIPDSSVMENQMTREVFLKINDQIKQKSHGRLFAVVYLCGKQFKVTAEDIIIVEGSWPPTIGDQLQLEKVMLAGGSDFTLIGRPILPRELVSVRATVIEKTLSHIKTHFRKKRRKQYMRINFVRSHFTMLRINSIEFNGLVNQTVEDSDFKERIF